MQVSQHLTWLGLDAGLRIDELEVAGLQNKNIHSWDNSIAVVPELNRVAAIQRSEAKPLGDRCTRDVGGLFQWEHPHRGNE
jgi:hypothetical protein